jgi:hypothetical protein
MDADLSADYGRIMNGIDEGNGRARRVPAVATKPVRVVLQAYSTEYAIYGTVLVSALIAVGWNDSTDLDVFWFMTGTVVVFWLAHIYAGTVARLQAERPGSGAMLRAMARSARHSAAMLLALLLPAVFLLLAALRVIDEYVAYYIALWFGVGVLAVLGYINSQRHGSPFFRRVLGALATAALGVAIIWLSSLVH